MGVIARTQKMCCNVRFDITENVYFVYKALDKSFKVYTVYPVSRIEKPKPQDELPCYGSSLELEPGQSGQQWKMKRLT